MRRNLLLPLALAGGALLLGAAPALAATPSPSPPTSASPTRAAPPARTATPAPATDQRGQVGTVPQGAADTGVPRVASGGSDTPAVVGASAAGAAVIGA